MNSRRTILSGFVALGLVAFSFSALGEAPQRPAQHTIPSVASAAR